MKDRHYFDLLEARRRPEQGDFYFEDSTCELHLANVPKYESFISFTVLTADFTLTVCACVCVCVRLVLVFVLSGNDSSVDGLVNFEKLRMIAKEIRHVVRLTSANMDPALMFRQRLVVLIPRVLFPLKFDQFDFNLMLLGPVAQIRVA